MKHGEPQYLQIHEPQEFSPAVFNPFKQKIFSALGDVAMQQSADYGSTVDGAKYIVHPFELPISSLRGRHVPSIRLGRLGVSTPGIAAAFTEISYARFSNKRGFVNKAVRTSLGVANPELFTEVVANADYLNPVDTYTGLTNKELAELHTEHAKLFTTAHLLLDKRGVCNGEYTGMDIVEEDSALKIISDPILHIVREQKTGQGVVMREHFVEMNRNSFKYMKLLEIEVAKQAMDYSPSGPDSMAIEDVVSMTRALGAAYLED